ncbi:hypothetical protein H0H87_007139 [Tephrocybe sp. NHM501043]|nr:hypothetical protein H0H87_007139 [Tephrocybe sp. NHM501043]
MNPGLIMSKSTGEPIFKFTAKEEAALNSLLEVLKDKESADATVSDALLIVFQVFYFSPPSKKAGLSGIYSPVISFILLEFIFPDGQAYNNSQLPPFLARCQFAIRLKAFHKFYKVRDVLKIGDHFLTLGQFKEFLVKKMAGLKIFVEQNLLFGLFKIADFDELLSRISDTGDQLTVGYGILADANATLPTIDTADSA